MERPWYLLVHQVAYGGRMRSQTLLVASAVGPLLFRLGQDPQLRSTHLLPDGEAPGRRLLFEASHL